MYDLTDIFNIFITEKAAKNLSKATIQSYIDSYDYFLSGRATSTADITSDLINGLINESLSKGMKVTTINHYLRDIRCFVYWLAENDYIEPVKVKMLRVQEVQPKLFTTEEQLLLLKKPDANDNFNIWRSWATVNIILATGARAGTIVSMRLGDIDYKNKEITYVHTKNKKAQSVPLSAQLEKALRVYIRLWRGKASNTDFLICNYNGGKATVNCIRQGFGKFAESRGVHKSNLHGLRHSYAKGFILNNGNVMMLQKILGHSSIETTQHYVDLFSDDLKRDFEQYCPLDKLLINKTKGVGK